MWAYARRNPLLFIILGAALLRATAAITLQYQLDHAWQRPFLIEGDAHGYWELAERIVRGESYSVHDPPRSVLRMPGLPAVLAVGIAMADLLGAPRQSFLIARLLLAAIGTAACSMVYLLGKELLGRTVGLAASALTAVLPTMIVFSVMILGETLFAACLTANLWLMAILARVRSEESLTGFRRTAVAFLAGVVGAAACYARPSWLLVVPLFALLHIALAVHRRRAIVDGVLIMAGLAICLAPWTLRNHQLTGHWIVTTLWLGPSLYDGLNPNATGDSDMQFFDDDDVMGNGMSEYEMNRYYRQEAATFVIDHPRRAVELAFIKLGRFWKPWPNAAQFRSWPARLAVACFFLPMMILAVCGWWVHRGRVWAWLLTIGPVLYFSVLHMIFIGSLRYRLPVEYLLCVMAAAGLCGLFSTRCRESTARATAE